MHLKKEKRGNSMNYKSSLLKSLIVATSILTLSACSVQSDQTLDSALITYSDKKVTIRDAYDLAVSQNLLQDPIHEVVIADVFATLYGDTVSKSDIDTQFNEVKSQYSTNDEFVSALKSAGLTEDSYREQLKSTIAYQKGLIDLLEIKDESLKELFESYTPEATIKLAVFEDESVAQNFVTAINSGSDFSSKATELKSVASTEDQSQVTFDSHDNILPSDVLTSIYQLKEGETSKVLSFINEEYGLKTYYVAQMVKPATKSNDWSEYKERLTEIYRAESLTNEEIVNSLEKKALAKANFKVVSDDYKLAFEPELKAKDLDK